MTAASADLTQLANNLARASGMGIETAAHEVLNRKAEEIRVVAVALAPRRTGRLAASITITWPNKLTAVIGPQAPYGAYQEFGTGSRGEFGGQPYEIRPKKSSYLVFTVGGKKIFAKKVMHPGIPPHPYMRPAVENALGDMASEMARTGALLITRGSA